MNKDIKKIIFTIYFYIVPQKNASYRYKFSRILTNIKFYFKKLISGSSYHLSSDEIAQRNRGDSTIELNENVIQKQFEILKRYEDFISNTLLKQDTSKTILDVGSREGSLLMNLKEIGYKSVTGFEVVPDWVKYCHQKGMDYIHEINLLEVDVTKNEKYDIVFSRHTLEHVDRTKLFFDKLVGLIKPKGILFIVFPINKRPNFKHPSYLPSIDHIKKNFDFSKLGNVTVGRLDELEYNGIKIDLTDPREIDEIVIIGTKL